MRKSQTLNKLFTSLFLILFTFTSPALAIEELITEASSEEIILPIEEDTSEDILEEGISDPEEIAKGDEVTEPEEESSPTYTYENGVYTVSEVSVGEYVYPDNSNVRVNFTEITESGNLVIKKVALSEEEKTELGTTDDSGWDITSTMSNGSFKYDLTLPNSQGENGEVVYTEDGDTYEEVSKEETTEFAIHIYGLDHFTTFVVVNPNSAGNGNTSSDDCQTVNIAGDQVCYDTIQGAIDAANDGDTINVAPGTYVENVEINVPNITLQSTDGRDVTIVDNPNVGAETWGIGVVANMGTVTIDGFTANNFRNGIGQGMSQAAGTSVIIKNNKIIPERMSTSPYLRNGIQVSGNGSQVLNNIIVGAPLTANWSSSAIGVVNASNVLVQGNTVNNSTVYAGIGISILNYSTTLVENITVQDNNTNGSKTGIQIAGRNNSFEVKNVVISNNELTNSPTRFGINAQTVSLENLTVTGNTITGNAYSGIRTSSSSAILDGDIVINDNNISSNSDYGIVFGATSTVNPTVTINRNNLENNLVYGIYNGTSLNIDGKYNRWGTSKESEIQNLIDGDVTYDPWYGKDVNSVLTVNEFMGTDGVYYVKGDTTLDFDLASSSVYGQYYHTGLWGYNPTTGSRTNSRYIGWQITNPDLLDNIFEVNAWDLETTGWMGSNPPGTVIEEGEYLLWTERYYDESGYVSGSTITERVTVDNTRPTGTIVTPADGFVTNDIVTVSGHAEDALSGVERVQVRLRTEDRSYMTDWVIADLDSNGDYTADIDTRLIPVGEYEVAVAIFDNVGNSRWPWPRPIITVDREAPAIPTGLQIEERDGTVLGCGGYTNTREIKINWDNNTTDADFDHFLLDLKDKDGHRTLTESEYDAVIRDIDGMYMYKIRAVDAVGNTSDASEWCSVTLDRVNPEGTIDGITYTTDRTGFVTSDDTPILFGTYADNIDVANVEIELGGTSIVPQYTNGEWESDEFGPLTEGVHTATLTITDLAGNVTVVTQDITVDTTAPTATYTQYRNGVEITEDIAYVQGVNELTFTGEYADNLAGLSTDSFVIFQAQDDGSFRFSANGKQAYCGWRSEPNLVHLSGLTDATDTPIEFSLCEATLPDGEYYMAHQVADEAVRDDIPSINQFRDVLGLHFIVDNVEPIVRISTPSNGEDIKGNLIVNTTITDDQALSGYYIRIRDIRTGRVVYSRQTTSGDIINQEILNRNFPDGRYEIFVGAQDKAGNRESETVRVIIDNTKPTGTVTTPVQDQRENDVLAVTGTVDDNLSGIERVIVILRSTDSRERTPWMVATVDTNGNFSLDIDTTTLSEGTYRLSVRAYDNAGNSRRLRQRPVIVVDRTAPVVTLTSPEDDYHTSDTIVRQVWGTTDTDLATYDYRSCNNNPVVDGFCDFIYGLNTPRQFRNVHNNNISFFWQVRGIDEAGNVGDWSEARSITIDTEVPVMGVLQDMTLTEGEAFPADTVLLTDAYGTLDRVFVEAEDLDPSGLGTGMGDVAVTGVTMVGDQFPIADEIRKEIEAWQGNPFTTIDLNVLPEGQYRITYYATDMAGNESTRQSFIVTIINNVPTVDIATGSTDVTVGDEVVLSANITDGNALFTYLWSGDCTGTEETTTLDTSVAGTYTCTVEVTDDDGDTNTDTIVVTVEDEPEVQGAATGPVYALGTGGGEQPTEEKTPEETEEEDTSEEVKGVEDDTTSVVVVDEDGSGIPWWAYLIIAVILIFIIFLIWRRRNEEEERLA